MRGGNFLFFLREKGVSYKLKKLNWKGGNHETQGFIRGGAFFGFGSDYAAQPAAPTRIFSVLGQIAGLQPDAGCHPQGRRGRQGRQRLRQRLSGQRDQRAHQDLEVHASRRSAVLRRYVLCRYRPGDDRRTLYITESFSPFYGAQGGLWRITRGGEVEECFHDALFTGTGALGFGVPVGANGIAYYHGSLYVTNTELGTVLQVPVWPDGSVGQPEPWTTLLEVPESPLAGAPLPVCGDGVVLDVHRNLYVAVLTRSAVVRLNLLDQSQERVG